MAIYGGGDVPLPVYEQLQETRVQPQNLEIEGIYALMFRYGGGSERRASKIPASISEVEFAAGAIYTVSFEIFNEGADNVQMQESTFNDGIWIPQRGVNMNGSQINAGYFRSVGDDIEGGLQDAAIERELERVREDELLGV